jgi:hypothetical protein
LLIVEALAPARVVSGRGIYLLLCLRYALFFSAFVRKKEEVLGKLCVFILCIFRDRCYLQGIKSVRRNKIHKAEISTEILCLALQGGYLLRVAYFMR